jgi:hypothetical protein
MFTALFIVLVALAAAIPLVNWEERAWRRAWRRALARGERFGGDPTMARATTRESKWTLVFTTKVIRFDTLQEAEDERDKAEKRGERAYILPPRAK